MTTRCDEVRKHAEVAFKNHQLTAKVVDGDIQVWRCQEPDTGVMAFWVTFLPHTIIVSGDIGDNILNVSDRQSLNWAVSVCGRDPVSYDYAASKIRTTEKAFNPEAGKEWLRSILEENEDEEDDRPVEDIFPAHAVITDILNDFSVWEDPSGLRFYEACQDAELDPEDVAHTYTGDHYWTIECLRTFARLYHGLEATTAINPS